MLVHNNKDKGKNSEITQLIHRFNKSNNLFEDWKSELTTPLNKSGTQIRKNFFSV